MTKKPYSQQEIDYLKENYGKILVLEIAKNIKRTPSSVRIKANELNLKSNIPYSKETHRKIALNFTKQLKNTAFLPSKELAYIIGVLNGDGSLGLRRFFLTTIDYDFLQNVKKIIEKWSGIEAKEYKYLNKKCWNYKQGFHYELCLNSVKVVEFLKEYYLSYNKKSIKKITKLLKNNKQLQIEFLNGFFDSEGSIRKQGRIAIDNSNKEIIYYLSYLLKKFKIGSKINYSEQKKRYKNKEYIIKMYRLYVQKKQDIKKFCNLINSSIKRKQDRILKFRTYD